MSNKNLAAFVVVVLGALVGIGCTNDTAGEPEPVETEKRANVQVPTPSADEASTPPTKPDDACPFTPGEEALVRCPACGVCAVAASCDDVCGATPPVGVFHDYLPWAPHGNGL